MEKKEGEGEDEKKGLLGPLLVLLVFPSSPYFAAMPFSPLPQPPTLLPPLLSAPWRWSSQ